MAERLSDFPLGWLDGALEALESAGLRRGLRVIEGFEGAFVFAGGRKLLNFGSNDYLGLARDQRVVAGAIDALNAWGAGSTASGLVIGHTCLHESLERALADLKGTQAALVFPSGFGACAGVISALPDRTDVILCDRLAHASILDGCALSGAFLRTFRHNDPVSLERELPHWRSRGQRCYVITESVFSMDGDTPPLSSILDLCRRYEACLVVDEAHATGVLGRTGRGGLEHLNASASKDVVIIGTLSKALGSQGGFVAGSRSLVQWITNKARPFMFSTSLAPPACGAALKALEVLRLDTQRVQRLAALSLYLRERLRDFIPSLPAQDPVTPIIPVITRTAEAAEELHARLLADGLFVPAIRPPSVPRRKSRLRITVTALHTEDHLDALADSLRRHIQISENIR